MPENTDSYEGYYHVSDIRGDVSQCIMTYHIRDFSAARYEERKKLLAKTASYLNLHYGAGTFEVQIDDYYLNMKRKLTTIRKFWKPRKEPLRWPELRQSWFPCGEAQMGLSFPLTVSLVRISSPGNKMAAAYLNISLPRQWKKRWKSLSILSGYVKICKELP